MKVSYLCTPAMLVDSLIKNRHCIKAHSVLIDLEDGTHVKSKANARSKIAEFDFSSLIGMGIELGLRINPISTYDGIYDIDLVRSLFSQSRCPFKWLFLPMVRDRGEVRIYRSLFETLPAVPKVFTIIETFEAVEDVYGIAAASDGLCFGQADLASTMYSPNEAFLQYARARLCLAAANHKIPAIDTTSFEFTDLAQFESECVAARKNGFTGKVAMHPNQVAAINKIFSVSQVEIDTYKSIIKLYINADSGFFLKDGGVIAPPIVAHARRMLEFYERNGACNERPGGEVVS